MTVEQNLLLRRSTESDAGGLFSLETALVGSLDEINDVAYCTAGAASDEVRHPPKTALKTYYRAQSKQAERENPLMRHKINNFRSSK